MVNTINTFGIVTRNDRNSVSDMNSINQLRQQGQCGIDNNSYYIDQPMFSPASCEYQVQQVTVQSPIIQPKPSPGYMDTDVQFNYPDVRPQNPNNFRGHATQEMPCQQLTPDTEPPVLNRQYSLTTVMEVIEDHVIDDGLSHSFGSSLQTDWNVNTQRTQSQDSELNIQGSFLTKPKPQFTVLAPPASDMREDKLTSTAYGSSVSSSPGGINFPSYREDFIQSPDNYSNVNHQSSVSTNYYSEAYTSTGLQATEDVMSPYQDQALEYQYNVKSPPYSLSENDPNYNDVFLSDNNHYPSFNQPPGYHSTLPSYLPETSSRANINTSGYSSQSSSMAPTHPIQTQSPAPRKHPFDSSPMVSMYPSQPSSMDPVHLSQSSPTSWANDDEMFAIAVEGNKYELEEIDELDEDLAPEELDRRKQDMKRIRNNKACRESRQRRKKRKLDQEKLVQNLEVDNRGLKEKIRRLERELKLTYIEVERRTKRS